MTILLLAACGNTGGLGASRNAPYGVDPKGNAVDPLLVGHRLMEAGEYELALKAYYGAAGTHGVNADTLSAVGSANLKLGRLGQAEQILRRAIEAEPGFVPALNNLGVVLMEQGKMGEARRVFEEAYARDSGQSDSIRQNLMRAIAATEANVYDGGQEDPGQYQLVRRDKGQYVLLTQL
ncbi:tetratricopeptide repeat protein [Xinfangfangia sp. CPCC 101601]|uniref:Tetratricopeptide repeat protein n=1 Tax=Pseudogemmobacter lacusdianii TaxID=3069608 RepID=A0ABU0VT27_9RHOB|nr:tetratricopeptide repeat protein [Xinfangfangia sp. CPCC 101601]MDQ2064884.1 tetratricopeptide repeat protein [Xinfangfangia sp. CPCC 101601]